ncbi:MAG: MFS transporter [Endomicrobiales bacterium]
MAKFKDKIRSSLKCSFIDGSFFSVMFGFGDSYFNPYAIFLKATNFQIGLLASLPGLISSLFQIRTPDWTEKVGRYRIMKWAVLFQVLLWVPIILLPYVFHRNHAPWLILGITLYLLSSSLAAPAWSSIMSQYLPAKKRGTYFSWRQRIHGTITFTATLLAGFVLFLFPRESVYGFTAIFSVAAVCRFFSWHYLCKMHEPRLVSKPGAYFSLWDFIARTRQSNFVKFVLFVGGISFAVNLAGPFFSVYMLRELKFDYLSFVVINTTPTLAMLLSLPAWGRHADRVGNLQVIRLSSLIIPLLPLMWLVTPYKPYLVFAQAVSGFAWAGFNLAVANFIFDAVSEEKRVRCIAYFNLINGLGVFLGATLGGFLAGRLPPLLGSGLLTIFLISGLLRLALRALLLPKVHEVKKVENVSTLNLFFSVIGVKPMIGIPQDAVRVE